MLKHRKGVVKNHTLVQCCVSIFNFFRDNPTCCCMYFYLFQKRFIYTRSNIWAQVFVIKGLLWEDWQYVMVYFKIWCDNKQPLHFFCILKGWSSVGHLSLTSDMLNCCLFLMLNGRTYTGIFLNEAYMFCVICYDQ